MDSIKINGETKLYGIVGNPVSHSFSPNMHTSAFQHLDQNAVYLAFKITEEQLPSLLDSFQVANIQGFNVTMPHKKAIIPYLQELCQESECLATVNTVRRTEKGWKGYCTDGSGFVRSLVVQDIPTEGSNILMIGAGGSAVAIALSLVRNGVAGLSIINRTESKAFSIVETLKEINPSTKFEVNPTSLKQYDILINTTSVGMDGKSLPVSEDVIGRCNRVIDIIYHPAVTPLMKKAQKMGIPAENGLGMLLYQGVEAFEIWTEKTAPVEIMQSRLMNSLKQKDQ